MNGPDRMPGAIDPAAPAGPAPAMAAAGERGDAPVPDPACLYGLVGQVARAGSDGTEANPYAIAANFMTYLACAVGRVAYLPVGNTWHHARLFLLHIGRSGRGRKGDALALVLRLDEALCRLAPACAPQVHRGGLSSREGLVALIHDGYRHGQQTVQAVDDKRLWVVESEFANVLHQGRRGGNTLSAALRDCWDGVCLKPATKSNRLYASHPHVCLSGAISPSELTALLQAREMSNGFANRFLMIWAERSQILPFPRVTPQREVDDLAREVLAVLQFVGAERHTERDQVRMGITPAAQRLYADLYRGELSQEAAHELTSAILERRAPMLLRLAMLLALCDMTTEIGVAHIDAAAAWIRYATASVEYVFAGMASDSRKTSQADLASRLVAYLGQRGQATRSEISSECFRGKVSKAQLDASLDSLLSGKTPRISVQTVPRSGLGPGGPSRVYRLCS